MSQIPFRKFSAAEVYFEKDGQKVNFGGMLKISLPVPGDFALSAARYIMSEAHNRLRWFPPEHAQW